MHALNFIIFDVETNGLIHTRHLVLSFSALHVKTWRDDGIRSFEVLEEFDRYYYPVVAFNRDAIRVNGLTPEVIEERRLRTGGHYPDHFNLDQDVRPFCERVALAVCHNTPFDSKFLKKAHEFEFPKSFCTIRNLTQHCNLPHPHYGIKWPKLEEAVQIICKHSDFAFHDSLSDCYAVLEILKVMGNSKEANGDKIWVEIFDEVFA